MKLALFRIKYNTIKKYGGVEKWLHALLTSWDGDEWSASSSRPFTLDSPYIEGRKCHWVGLNVAEILKISPPFPGIEPRFMRRPVRSIFAIPTELYRVLPLKLARVVLSLDFHRQQGHNIEWRVTQTGVIAWWASMKTENPVKFVNKTTAVSRAESRLVQICSLRKSCLQKQYRQIWSAVSAVNTVCHVPIRNRRNDETHFVRTCALYTLPITSRFMCTFCIRTGD
jgi:hypothetical protein